ncbi:hypothetical protein [Paraburkholderia sp. BL25I1N1]|uniref:hypothetical protein n=1 Tax=Paraburkholderia sp. BL25I1N1 TaxID=1938804 RepID=UPI002158F554|nr:hypothetical protein [Paraburkholderia sp. BL25I1N1]
MTRLLSALRARLTRLLSALRRRVAPRLSAFSRSVARSIGTTALFPLLLAQRVRGLGTTLAATLQLPVLRRILSTIQVLAGTPSFLAARRLRPAASGVLRFLAASPAVRLAARIIFLRRRLRTLGRPPRFIACSVFRRRVFSRTAHVAVRIMLVRLRIFRGAPRLARRVRRVAFGVLRIAALRVAGLRLIGGRRRILVRRSGTFGYIRHGGAL